ncbi:hypothetical protein BGZ75_005049 [Mortierella antarctica]|nr:hypothetical protein BGZ75_005049 [Mortierella antarctica]
MASSLQKALCCWASSQQSPVDDRPLSPSSPSSPCSAQSPLECTCSHIHDKSAGHCCYHERLAHAQFSHNDEKLHKQHADLQQKRLQQKIDHALKKPTRTWPRTSHMKEVLSKKNSAPSALDVVSPYHSTTFMLTPPSAYAYNGNIHPQYNPSHSHPHHSQHSAGKSPSKRISLQKYYYGRNTMSARMTPSRTPSPPPSSTISSTALSPTLAIASIAASTASLHTAAARSTEQSDNAGSLSTVDAYKPIALSIVTPTPQSSANESTLLQPPILKTILATPTSPSPPSFPAALSCSPPSFSSSLSPNTDAFVPSTYPSPSSPSFSTSYTSITAPERSETTPFPASGLSAARLAHLLDQDQRPMSASAGSRRQPARPLILDLRPNPDFHPLSITNSININLPTLLVRRYRRMSKSGSVSSLALESFITMPSDKDLYYQILDSWRQEASEEEGHDVVILDQDMKSGEEEFGRSASAAWTLLHVLERGGGAACFSGAPIRLWYLEGGFEAFQSWDAGEKFLVRPEDTDPVERFTASPSPSLSPAMQGDDKDVEMALAVPSVSSEDNSETSSTRPAGMARKPSLAIDTSVVFTPKPKAPIRRESLFSLNTKSLQRPAPLNRSQTCNTKSMAIPPPINTQQQPHQQQHQPKGSWLTVPALSPAMSMASNHSMEMAHSPSDQTCSTWSAGSGSMHGSVHFSGLTLNSKRSVSSLATLNSAIGASSSTASVIREEDESKQSMYTSDSGMSSGSGSSSNNNSDTLNSESMEDDGEQEISCILPNFLYLGPEIVNEVQVAELERLGVKRILNMATECEDLLVANNEPKSCKFEYHKIGVYDHIDADVSAGLLQAVDIIAASPNAPIYVHCKAGKSRSVTATIAYLITQLHWPLNRAYQHVLTHRPCMCPNIGFVTELMRMEERTLGAEKAGGLYGNA